MKDSDRQAALEALGRAIRSRRLALGMSQEDLAFRVGLDRTYVGGVERGERNVSFVNLLAITKGLETPIEELMRAFSKERHG